MKKDRAKELIPVIQAYTEGKTIQYKGCSGKWADVNEPAFLDSYSYRVKPEPIERWVNVYVGGEEYTFKSNVDAEYHASRCYLDLVRIVHLVEVSDE